MSALSTFRGHVSDHERQTGNYNSKNLACNCVEISHPHNADSLAAWISSGKGGKNHHVWVLSANLILVLFLIMFSSLSVQEITSQCGESGRGRRKRAGCVVL